MVPGGEPVPQRQTRKCERTGSTVLNQEFGSPSSSADEQLTLGHMTAVMSANTPPELCVLLCAHRDQE
jgi:hypothetical protein